MPADEREALFLEVVDDNCLSVSDWMKALFFSL